MILADTSVWIDHLRKGEPALADLLRSGRILTHPFIIGELALGHLGQRKAVLGALQNLSQATVATEDEVMRAIDRWTLFGNGIGYMDAHLLATAALSPGTLIWTRDKRLRASAERLGLHAGLA